MAIGTYAELQTAAANWSGRADLTSRITEFISLAEAKMNRRLRTIEMVTRDTNFSVTTAATVAVPTNFAGVKAFTLNTTPLQVLQFLPQAMMNTVHADGATGKPEHYTVSGSVFQLGPRADQTYSATLVYYLKVPALSGSNTTNWMLTSHPDAYVYGVMSELAGFAKDWAAAEKWTGAMYAVIDEIKKSSGLDSYGGDAVLAMRPG